MTSLIVAQNSLREVSRAEQTVALMSSFVRLNDPVRTALPDSSEFKKADAEVQKKIIARVFWFNCECDKLLKENDLSPDALVERINAIVQRIGLSFATPLHKTNSRHFLESVDPYLFHKVKTMAPPAVQREMDVYLQKEIWKLKEQELIKSLVPMEKLTKLSPLLLQEASKTALDQFAAVPEIQGAVLERVFSFMLQCRLLKKQIDLNPQWDNRDVFERILGLVKSSRLSFPITANSTSYWNFINQVDLHLFQKMWSVTSETVKNQIKQKQFKMTPPFLFKTLLNSDFELFNYLLSEGFTAQVFYLVESSDKIFEKCDTLLSFARKLFVSNPSLFERIERADNGFTDKMLQVKLLGHRLNFKGFNFEGMTPLIVRGVIFESIYRWALDYFPFVTRELLNDVFENFQSPQSNVNLLYEQAQKDSCTIFTGWKGHATICMFAKNICIKIDTDVKNKSGIRFFHIKNTSEQNVKSVMSGLIAIKGQDGSVGQDFFDETVNTQLNLEEFAYIPMKQKGGHCVWISCKAVFKTLLFMDKAKKDNEVLTQSFIDSAAPSINALFAQWELWDINQAIQKSMVFVKEYPNYFDAEEVTANIESELGLL